MMISIIAAIGPNRELGRDNKLLWHISEDLQRFKRLTQGHAVIMGRKTFESIGKPLPNRYNIIITSNKLYQPPNLVHSNVRMNNYLICSDLSQAIIAGKRFEEEKNTNEMFIIGGASIYKQAINLADKLYLTLIEGKFEADAYFPDYSAYKKEVFRQENQNSEFKFTFLELTK